MLLNPRDGWSFVQEASDHPQVTIATTKTDWAEYLANRPEARPAGRVRVEGSPEAVEKFTDVISAFPFGRVAGAI